MVHCGIEINKQMPRKVEVSDCVVPVGDDEGLTGFRDEHTNGKGTAVNMVMADHNVRRVATTADIITVTSNICYHGTNQRV
jgi:hypothetical protein